MKRKINTEKLENMVARTGVTAKEFLEKCGISRPTYYLILNRGTCRNDILCKLASALDVDISDLLEQDS